MDSFLGSTFYFKKFRVVAFFRSIGSFPQRIDPTVPTVSKPNSFLLIFLLVTVTPALKLQEAF